MAFGISIKNSSGVVSFDSSRMGGVLLDNFAISMTPSTTYNYSYNVPVGAQLKVFAFPSQQAWVSDSTITTTPGDASGNATVTIVSGLYNVYVYFIIMLV